MSFTAWNFLLGRLFQNLYLRYSNSWPNDVLDAHLPCSAKSLNQEPYFTQAGFYGNILTALAQFVPSVYGNYMSQRACSIGDSTV